MLKSASIIVTSLFLAVIPCLAFAQIGFCDCSFSLTSTEIPATAENCSSLGDRINSDCVWGSGACYCTESFSNLSVEECENSAQETLTNAYRLQLLPGAQAVGSCVWNPIEEEEEDAGSGLPGSPGETTSPAPERVELQPPFGQRGQDPVAFIQENIGLIIRWALGFIGSLSLLMFVYGGFLWLTSAGSSDRIKKGKGVLIWSAIGLAAVLSAYAITEIIISTLSGR